MVMKMNLVFSLVLVLAITASAQERVFSWNTDIDTSEYDYYSINLYAVEGPESQSNFSGISNYSGIFQSGLLLFMKKDGKTVDVYTITGSLLESFTISIQIEPRDRAIFSKTFIDNDNGWECIRNRGGIQGDEDSFEVFDDDGSILLQDKGFCTYGFDGASTYVLNECLVSISSTEVVWANSCIASIWRFRTNISSSSPQVLSKGKSIAARSVMCYTPTTGNYRINFQPCANGTATVQLLDMLGRCIFSEHITDLSKPKTVNVSSGNVPRTPFIAKVRSGDEEYIKREIPVR